VLTTSGSVGNDWVVTGGVKQDDRLIVDGLQKISNGTSVNPVEVTIDDNGVVKQEIKATGAAEPSAAGAPAQ
jgi:membrane fusion protein (multidrug efflux system)